MLYAICNIIAWFVDKLLIGPLWFVASYIASIVHPYEESYEHWAISLGICCTLVGVVCAALYFALR